MTARVVLSAVVLFAALLLTTIVAPIVAVAGIRPDLVLLSVIAFGFLGGRAAGARYGFAAGLLSDLLSSAAQLVGLGALAALLVGYLAGVARPFVSSEPLGQAALAAGGTLVAGAAAGLLALLLDAAPATLPAVARQVAGMALYHALLAPLVFPLVARLGRSLETVAP